MSQNQFRSPIQFQPPPTNNPQMRPNPSRSGCNIWVWYRTRGVVQQFVIGLFLVFLVGGVWTTLAFSVYLSSTSMDKGIPPPTPIQSTPAQSPTPRLSPPTPTLQQVVQNSGKYDCCLADGAANVGDLEATETSDGTVQVLAKVGDLPWPANAVDVGKALIFQYMAAVWTSRYHPQSVVVTIIYQGSLSGAIQATMTQDTANVIDWSKANPFGCWGVYDSTSISPSLTA
jgi:hypothetical protein